MNTPGQRPSLLLAVAAAEPFAPLTTEFDLAEAEHGAALAATAERLQPALLVIDSALCDTCGEPLWQTARRHPRLRDLPLLLVIAGGAPADEALAHADDYLVMPCAAAELRLRARQAVIRGRRAHGRVYTERRSIIRRTETRLRLFLEYARDYALVLLDPEGQVADWLGGAEAITGWTPEEMIGQPVERLFTPEDRAQGTHLAELETAATCGRAEDRRWHVKKDGKLFFADGIMTALRDDAGQLHGFGKIFRDATVETLANQTLRESEQRLQSLLDSVVDGICGIDAGGVCTFANAAAGRLLGFEHDELVGQCLHSLVYHSRADGTARPAGECRINAAMRDGTADRVDEEVFWRKDGTAIPVQYLVNPVIVDGTTTGAVVVFADITERRRAEVALRESERRLRFVMDTMPQKIFTSNAAGEIDYCNPAWFTFAGIKLDEVSGWQWTDLVHPDDLPHNLRRWRHSLRSGEPLHVEHRLRNRDGHYRWHLSRAKALRDEAGQIMLWVGSTTDIHHIKSAAEGLSQSLATERHNSALLARVAAASRTVHAGLSAERIAAVMAEEIRSILQAHQATVSLAANAHSPQIVSYLSQSEESAQVRAAGERTPASARVLPLSPERARHEPAPAARHGERLTLPLTGHDGQQLGLIQVAHKRQGGFSGDDEAILNQLALIAAAAIENARLYDSLREQDRCKDQFLATLAHELRNPLAPIRTGLDLLHAGGDATTGEVRAMMERQLTHMVRLVDDLMDVSRVSRGKVELKRARVALREIIDMAVELVTPLINASHHHLGVTLPDAPLFIHGDATRLAQIFSNLLNNAAKYTDDGGEISLMARREVDQAVVSVTDTGIGLSQEMLVRVFDLFVQVAPPFERPQGGLGIGLSLAQKLVELHGGTIAATSPGLGQGATFTVRLPLSLESLPAAAAEPPRPTTAAAGLRVLVVDDNVDAAEALAGLLELSGHTSRVVHHGNDVLPIATQFGPQAVLLDLGLPGMNGYEVAVELRRDPAFKDLLIIALTGWSSDEDRRRAREVGFDLHLTKPASAQDILTALEHLRQGQGS